MSTVTSSVDIPRQQYIGSVQNPRLYGPFRIDKFTRDDVDSIRVKVFWEPTWPQVTLLFKLMLAWEDDARGCEGTYSGFQPTKMGVIFDSVGMGCSVPKRLGVKRDVTRGDLSMEVYQTFTARILVEAIKD